SPFSTNGRDSTSPRCVANRTVRSGAGSPGDTRVTWTVAHIPGEYTARLNRTMFGSAETAAAGATEDQRVTEPVTTTIEIAARARQTARQPRGACLVTSGAMSHGTTP